MALRRSQVLAISIGIALSVVAILNTRQHVLPSEFFHMLTKTDIPPDAILESIERRLNGL